MRDEEAAQPCRYHTQPCKYDTQLYRTGSCLVDHYSHHVKVEQAAMRKSSLHFEADALTVFTLQIILAHH